METIFTIIKEIENEFLSKEKRNASAFKFEVVPVKEHS